VSDGVMYAVRRPKGWGRNLTSAPPYARKLRPNRGRVHGHPLPSPPSPSLLCPFLFPSPPTFRLSPAVEVGLLNPARESGGAL